MPRLHHFAVPGMHYGVPLMVSTHCSVLCKDLSMSPHYDQGVRVNDVIKIIAEFEIHVIYTYMYFTVVLVLVFRLFSFMKICDVIKVKN